MAESPDPMPGVFKPVRVTVSGGALNDLSRMREVTAQVLKRLGCGNCHSGYDLRFQQEGDLFAHVDAQGAVRVVGFGER